MSDAELSEFMTKIARFREHMTKVRAMLKEALIEPWIAPVMRDRIEELLVLDAKLESQLAEFVKRALNSGLPAGVIAPQLTRTGTSTLIEDGFLDRGFGSANASDPERSGGSYD